MTHQEPSSSETGGTLPGEEVRYPGKGFRVGEFVVEKTLGHGSMATVYLARDATGHEVAIKLFQEGPGVSPTMLERFRREAEATKKLRRHPNIMKVYATGREGPYHFIVMEPVLNSKTLDDCLETTSMTVEEIVRIVVKIARALHYAHSRGIVHRDVKPTNIMIDEFGEPMLSDFGVAALIDWPSCTVSGALTGTPLYMSPEQARSERVGPASDIYSLGVVLYEALTNALPYSSQHNSPVKQVLEAVKHEHPRRPRHYRRDLSPDLEAVILKAIEKHPDKRYPDAEAFAGDLERVLAGRHVTARLFSYWEQVLFLVKRYDQFFVAAFVMVMILSTAWLFFRQQMISTRHDNLRTLLSLRNYAAQVVSRPGTDNAKTNAGAWQHIRSARRRMQSGDWQEASGDLRVAVEISLRIGDRRTAAIAELDLARCMLLTGDLPVALDIYRSIIRNLDASPATFGHAQLEALMLSLIGGNRAEAIELLGMHSLPPAGPIRDSILCLSGELSTDQLEQRIPYMPFRFQNDALMAIAVRHRMNNDQEAYAEALRVVLQSSTPTSDWPAPFARVLRSELR